MTTSSSSQFESNMLRRIILALLLYCLLAICYSLVLQRRVYHGVSIPIGCSKAENSGECEVKRIDRDEDRRNETAIRTFRGIRDATLEYGTEEVTSRRKKNKKYGYLLMYSLGALKMVMLYILINMVAAIAGKALIIGKVALAIATAILLKKASDSDKISYKMVYHPHYSYEQTHSASVDMDRIGGYWKRDFS